MNLKVKISLMSKSDQIIELVSELSEDFTKIIPRSILRQHSQLNWGNNGIGNRWAKGKFNYTVVYANRKTKSYSDNEYDKIEPDMLQKFLSSIQKTERGIVGIFPHSVKDIQTDLRPINPDIKNRISSGRCCVNCGTKNEIICDHKNDLYNDPSVLNVLTQTDSDFQPLCNHCNLQKRQIAENEHKEQKLFTAKDLPQFKMYEFDFPWEKKTYDVKNPDTKKDTYWYDPIEFMRKVRLYDKYVFPIVHEIKLKNHK